MPQDIQGQAALVRRYRPSSRLGEAALYVLHPPILSDISDRLVSYVVLSTVRGWTRAFPADASGAIESWLDVVDIGPAGAGTHEEVLAAMGYTIAPGDSANGPQEAAPETSPQPTDPEPAERRSRPYPPEVVRKAVQARAAKGASELASQALRTATVGAIEALFSDATEYSRPLLRHRVTVYLLSKESSGAWTYGDCQALLAWAQAQREDNTIVPSDMAREEAAAITRMLDGMGQQRFVF